MPLGQDGRGKKFDPDMGNFNHVRCGIRPARMATRSFGHGLAGSGVLNNELQNVSWFG